MKTILIVTAMIGFSAPVAFADCIAHDKVNASISVDREFKTASITPPTEPAQKPVLVLKKMDRLSSTTETAVASPQSALQRMQ